jgi:hypothetical protein
VFERQGVRGIHANVRKDMDRDIPGTVWISALDMATVQARRLRQPCCAGI